MIDLSATYQQLARPWTHQQLAARYQEANRRGEAALKNEPGVVERPISLLAGGIPASSSFSVAIYTLHVLRAGALGRQEAQLLDVIANNAATVLYRCHRTLDLDSRTHGYAAADWLPVVYDTATTLLEAARLDRELPSLVRHAQEAVHWVASAIIDLDHDAPETPEALADALGRLLTLSTFANAARAPLDRRDE